MFTCPEKHQSQTADFCSVCGVEIPQGGAATTLLANAAAPAGTGERCPDCGAEREGPTAVYCEGCGYNFRDRAPGAGPAPKPAAVAPVTAAAATTGSQAPRWDVIVRVDAALYGKPNPDAPTDQPAQTFTLFDAENMIGRDGSGVRLQVPIRNDPGVSRRQALLLRLPDGGLIVRDLGSANGTQLNGVELVAGVDNPLRDGDSLAVGAWTRIAIRAVV
jgi:hypothetical protein